mmetsp:Transcript_10798/g.14935  ORF Transcript_10798/g.14935 Transcript_10798/m.14935 type:complete len:80 (-) Transcript_10798:75-314(-)
MNSERVRNLLRQRTDPGIAASALLSCMDTATGTMHARHTHAKIDTSTKLVIQIMPVCDVKLAATHRTRRRTKQQHSIRH